MPECSATNLVWIDLEMTGLRPEKDRILEIAVVVTDRELHIIHEGPVLTVHQPEAVLANMDAWNTRHHTESGLLKRVRQSPIDDREAEAKVLAILRQFVPAGTSPLCGNSICQDRRFLYRYMPRLEQFLHYRNLDVSTLKILAQCWAPSVYDTVDKSDTHRALQDIRESIAELRHYRRRLFRDEWQ